MENLIFEYDNKLSVGAPFVSDKISRKAISRFFERAKELKVDVHAFQVWKDNELQIRMSLPPYDCTDKRLYYSLSKSFTATAVGLACDEGLVSVDTKIIDIFPEFCPENISENLAKCCVKHVLSMNSGVETDTTRRVFAADDIAKEFLSSEFVYEPGTHFVYDTGATAMLAAIVKKVTGLSALDYLDIKLFKYMDIRDVYWDKTADGTIQGGTGFHASNDDAAKLGLLYINRGVWNGKRLLSEEWIDDARAVHSDNSPHEWIDWRSGYGYQFWNCSRGGYRGDGAFGQYCFILPDSNIVASALCEAENLQYAVDIVHDMALELFNENESTDDIEAQAENFYAAEKTQPVSFELPEYYKAQENNLGVTFVKLDNIGDEFVLAISNGLSLTNVRCGNGKWIRNRTSTEYFFAPSANAQTSERTAGLAASYKNENGVITVEMRNLYSPHHLTLTITKENDDITLEVSGLTANRLPENKLKAKKV